MNTLSAVHRHRLLMPHVTHFHVTAVVRSMLHAAALPESKSYSPDLNSIFEDAALAREMRRL